MLDTSAEPPAPAPLNWRVGLALAAATFVLTFVSRWISPLGSDAISMVWPACGVMLAASIRFGLPGALASAAGLAAWAICSFPATPSLWITAVGTDLAACVAGTWFMNRMAASQLKRSGRSRLSRTEWLYALYAATIAVAALVAGLLASLGRPASGLYAEFSFLEVAGGYWVVQSLGYVLFAPATLAILSASGFGHPQLPFSTQRLSWRASIDWPTMLMALLLAAALLAMVWTGLLGYARVLVVWAFALMAWTAARKPALPTYLSLIAIIMTVLPARTLAVLDEEHVTALKFFEVFEGILMSAVAAFITLIIQAVVHENKTQQQELEQRLRIDVPSGLLNEHGLREALVARSDSTAAAIVLLYFPALPQLAASLGSERAQRVQSALAQRIGVFGDHAARLDSTSYCCVWLNAQEDTLPQRLEQIKEQLAGLRIRAGEGTVRLQCQTGVLILDAAASSAGEPYAEAVLAAVWQLEGALHAPRQTPLTLRMSDQLNLAARERNERVLLIRQALEQGAVEVYAQPIESNINPPGTDSPLMFEALARLRLADGTLLSPGAFLPIAEQNGLIRQLDRTMIHKTFTWFAARPDALTRLARCSINLSGQSISAEGIAAEVRTLANTLNLPVGKFSFEITESEAIQDANVAVRAVADLRAAGFGTAIDDFGTGLATFSYLKRFEVDLIKIDGAFIRPLDDGVRRAEVDREIVRSIVRVAQSLGVKTAAEFVETQAIREHVTALGVHYSQGYAIGKAVPIAEFFK